MVCPFCGNERLRTYNSRRTKRNHQVWRRRQCESCRRSFTTREIIDLSGIDVIKRNGATEPYSRSKLLLSLARACEGLDQIHDIAFSLSETIEAKIMRDGIELLTSNHIADVCGETLHNFNTKAFMRYQSYQADPVFTLTKTSVDYAY